MALNVVKQAFVLFIIHITASAPIPVCITESCVNSKKSPNYWILSEHTRVSESYGPVRTIARRSMDPNKQPTTPPPSYSPSAPAGAPYVVHPVTPVQNTAQYAAQPQYYPGQPGTHSPHSSNNIYYAPPPPGAYPSHAGYAQAYVPAQTIIIKETPKDDDADTICACLLGALLCCCCLDIIS
jgi:hypothetical protein